MPCCAIVGWHLQAQRHAVLLGVAEVDHPAHAFIDRGLVVRRGNRVVRIRADCGLAIDGRTERDRNQRTAGCRDRNPALRHHACERRALPCAGGRILLHRGRRELRLDRQRRVGRDRCGRPVADIRRTQRPRDPGRALRIEAIAKLLPRETLAGFVASRTPDLLPEMLTPEKLVLRQARLVRIDVHLIGIHAHAQLLSRGVGQREETRFEPHRQHEQRRVGWSERRSQLGRQRRRNEREQIAGRRKQLSSHGYLLFRLIVGLVSRLIVGFVVAPVAGLVSGAVLISSDA